MPTYMTNLVQPLTVEIGYIKISIFYFLEISNASATLFFVVWEVPKIISDWLVDKIIMIILSFRIVNLSSRVFQSIFQYLLHPLVLII